MRLRTMLYQNGQGLVDDAKSYARSLQKDAERGSLPTMPNAIHYVGLLLEKAAEKIEAQQEQIEQEIEEKRLLRNSLSTTRAARDEAREAAKSEARRVDQLTKDLDEKQVIINWLEERRGGGL